jgi:hypothetical protein
VPRSTWLEMSWASLLTDLGVRVFQAFTAFGLCGWVPKRPLTVLLSDLAVAPGCAVCRFVLSSQPTCEV